MSNDLTPKIETECPNGDCFRLNEGRPEPQTGTPGTPCPCCKQPFPELSDEEQYDLDQEAAHVCDEKTCRYQGCPFGR